MDDKMVIVLARGHSGTRVISQTLLEAGFYMGEQLNDSFDLVPAHYMYQAAKVCCSKAHFLGDGEWDFSGLADGPPTRGWEAFVKLYIQDVLAHDGNLIGWKLPETILSAPWIMKMFPDAYYIWWVRHPWDNMLGAHLTDEIGAFGIAPDTPDPILNRALSYKYQYDIIAECPQPKNMMTIKFEDFVLNQDEVISSLSEWLGVELPKVGVKPGVIGRWKELPVTEPFDFEFLHPIMDRFDYRRTKDED